MKTVKLSEEAASLIEWAKSSGYAKSGSQALDWLLRDLCEYGSPIVGHQARQAWPDSVETKEWHRKRKERKRMLGQSPSDSDRLSGSTTRGTAIPGQSRRSPERQRTFETSE